MKTEISLLKVEVHIHVPPPHITTFSSPKYKDILSLYKGSVPNGCSRHPNSARASEDSVKHESTRPLENSQEDGLVASTSGTQTSVDSLRNDPTGPSIYGDLSVTDLLSTENARSRRPLSTQASEGVDSIINGSINPTSVGGLLTTENARSRRTRSTQASVDSFQNDSTNHSGLTVGGMLCIVIMYSLSVALHIAAIVLGFVSFLPCQYQKYNVLFMISSGTYGILVITWMTLMQLIKTTSADKAKTLVAWVGLILVSLPIASTFTFASCGAFGMCGQNSQKRDWSNITCLTLGNFCLFYRYFNIFFWWIIILFIFFYKNNSIFFYCCWYILLSCSFFLLGFVQFLNI